MKTVLLHSMRINFACFKGVDLFFPRGSIYET